MHLYVVLSLAAEWKQQFDLTLQQVDSSSHLGPLVPQAKFSSSQTLFWSKFKEIQNSRVGVKIRSVLFSMYSLNRVRKYCCFHFITLYFGGTTFFFFNKVRRTLSQEAVHNWVSWTDGRLKHITKVLLWCCQFYFMKSFGINWESTLFS